MYSMSHLYSMFTESPYKFVENYSKIHIYRKIDYEILNSGVSTRTKGWIKIVVRVSKNL